MITFLALCAVGYLVMVATLLMLKSIDIQDRLDRVERLLRKRDGEL